MRGAASAMRAAAINEIIDALTAMPVTALDQHRADTPSPEAARPWLAIAAPLSATGSSSSAAASGRLGVISDARGMRLVRKLVYRVRGQQTIARCRHHHRIEYDVFRRPARKPGNDGLDGPTLRHHPDLDGLDVEIAKYGIDLRGDEIGRYLMNAADAGGVLRGQRRDNGSTIDPECRKRLEVRLHAGPA